MPRPTPLPSRRTSRLLQLGRLTGAVAGAVLVKGTRRLAAGEWPAMSELLLTPGNANRLANRLSEMRGAATKFGQLLSMEAGDYLPPEVTAVLARLREDANPMPLGQVADVLEQAWGAAWKKGFERFWFTPLAAASIGQVHEALMRDGRHLAVKVQYPGVRDAIDSDLRNLAALLRLLRLVPPEIDLAALLEEARAQLYQEADYLAEAAAIVEYSALLGNAPGFILPSVQTDLTRPEVLAMSFVPGHPVEELADAPSETRNKVATRLLDLALRELLQWGFVQTDAHFGNYRYDPQSERIGLLDFGATRRHGARCMTGLRRLIGAAVRGDRGAIEDQAMALGYLRADEVASCRDAMVNMIATVAEPACRNGQFGFATSDLSQRVAAQAAALRLRQRYWHLPPLDILFLHRKLAGTYLLCARLRAQVEVAALVEPYLL
jgi:predicted unusual protein kinase regulating ubiquinone biosynthesis (AarF/ABC1/UbiB family)